MCSPLSLAKLAALFFLETKHPRTQPPPHLAIGQHGGGTLQAAAGGCRCGSGGRLILRLFAGGHGQGPAQMDVVGHNAIACSAAAASPCTVSLPQSWLRQISQLLGRHAWITQQHTALQPLSTGRSSGTRVNKAHPCSCSPHNKAVLLHLISQDDDCGKKARKNSSTAHLQTSGCIMHLQCICDAPAI